MSDFADGVMANIKLIEQCDYVVLMFDHCFAKCSRE